MTNTGVTRPAYPHSVNIQRPALFTAPHPVNILQNSNNSNNQRSLLHRIQLIYYNDNNYQRSLLHRTQLIYYHNNNLLRSLLHCIRLIYNNNQRPLLQCMPVGIHQSMVALYNLWGNPYHFNPRPYAVELGFTAKHLGPTLCPSPCSSISRLPRAILTVTSCSEIDC